MKTTNSALLWLGLSLAVLWQPAPCIAETDAEAEIREGIRLHDLGEYGAAITAFERALERDPGNPLAHYEMANTYFADGNFESCVAAAEKGLAETGKLQGGLRTLAGTCYSSMGKPRKALRQFRKALEIDPENAMLNFNVAITLTKEGETDKAIAHLQTAIDSRPGYSSPYLVLGQLHGAIGSYAKGVFYFSRFVTLEPNSARTAQASAGVFEFLQEGVEREPDDEIKVSVFMGEEDDPFGTLEMSRSLAAAAMHVEKDEEGEEEEQKSAAEPATEARRHVDALVNFFQMAQELSDRGSLRETKTWDQAIVPILAIHDEEGSKPLAYLMTARAGISGGQSWLETHPEEIERLSDLLSP